MTDRHKMPKTLEGLFKMHINGRDPRDIPALFKALHRPHPTYHITTYFVDPKPIYERETAPKAVISMAEIHKLRTDIKKVTTGERVASFGFKVENGKLAVSLFVIMPRHEKALINLFHRRLRDVERTHPSEAK